VLLKGLALATYIQCVVNIRLVGVFDDLTASAVSDVKSVPRKQRSPEEKYGKYKWIKILISRLAEDQREIKRDLRQLTFGLRHLMEFDSQFLEETVCQDSRDEAILQVLRQSYPEGKLPKDIWHDVHRHGLQYHHVTRRIKRMKK
jgi:hypothetical protein